MATIELSPLGDNTSLLAATMLFPNDEATRWHYMQRTAIQCAVTNSSDEDNFKFTMAEVQSLLDSPSRAEMVSMITEATKEAYCAGDLLASLYLMNLFSHRNKQFRRPSMNKAVHASMEFGLMHKFGDGKPLHRSETKIRKCWESFRTTAHLWAAYRLMHAYYGPDSFARRVGSQDFLQFAAGLYSFGVTFALSGNGQQTHVLDRSTSWALPEWVDPIELISPGIPDRLVKYMETYKAQ